MKTNRKAYINGFTSISCAGLNNQTLFNTICEKKDSISLDSSYVQGKVVAIGKINTSVDFDTLVLNSCKEVLTQSNLEDYSSTLLVVGSSVGGMQTTEQQFFKDDDYKNIDYKVHAIDAIAYKLNQEFSFYDDISFSTACTSSANALGYAKEVIEKGIYANVLVVGVDSLSHTTVCGFSALSVLSSSPCTPFEKEREGMNVAEGIAVILLQDTKISTSIQVCGVGYSSDAHHMTQPHPDGIGAMQAMKNALANAQINDNEIDYINAHGTGTMANDTSELRAISTLFEHMPIVSSTKAYTGHTLGAAGALEAIICSLSIQNQKIPPSKNLINPEESKVKFSNEVIPKKLNYVMSNSFAFGGNNTSLILGRCNEN